MLFKNGKQYLSTLKIVKQMNNRFRYYFTDKLNLKNNKTIALAKLGICFTWKNTKS